ncbi:putative Heterokaryon incompatibility domain-containing protein [Seiridium unicorne]|uniref:Heterokaryon incompatibility domain-containing protein n=1 Tax=Seiridium unicorne TaxID=138068 RepID=A0ABR2V8Q0_9PEZI
MDFPLYLSSTEWRAEQAQWRLTGSDFWSTPAEFLVVQDDSQPLPVLQEVPVDMSNLRTCVSNCLKNHQSCNTLDDTSFPMDFRLVDVEKGCILSVLSATPPEYVALSYIWGEAENTDWSTKSNIAERLKSLDTSIMPATLRDAMIVCEKLGERYIWIDRLCILQDNEVDKSSQVQAMASIYSAAKFVIIDASGRSMNDGIVGASRPRKSQISERLCGLVINVQLPPLWDVVGPSCWNSRGWTYQEALLSKRKVFYTESQIFYECAVHIDHEEMLSYDSFNHALHDKVRYPTTTTSLCYNASKDCSARLRQTKLIGYKSENSWGAYSRHLPRYRQRTLRHASDLVKAFLGILDALYPVGKSYGGLPLLDLDMALLWQHWKDPYIRKRPLDAAPTIRDDTPTLFPSWSWASVPHAIPDYDDPEVSFCGPLCRWFQPNDSHERLQLIVAANNTPQMWLRNRITSDTARGVLAKAICSSMIESPVCPEATLWCGESSAALAEELPSRWPSYDAFWLDVYGQKNSIQLSCESLMDEVHGKIRAGVLVARTQAAAVMIRKVELENNYRWSRQKDHFRIENMLGDSIGTIKHQSNHQISSGLLDGIGVFTTIALSVSAEEVSSDQNPQKDDSRFPHEEKDNDRLEQKVWVNTMVIRRHVGYSYRIGLARIDLDRWLDLTRTFETVVLA